MKKIIEKSGKRGVSALVATVLLVLITIAAIGIIWGAILPIIQKGIGTSKECSFDRQLTILEEGYTCFNASSPDNLTLIQIQRPLTQFTLSKIKVMLSGEGKTRVYEINETTTPAIPRPGESNTYYFSAPMRVERAEVVPVIRAGTQDITCENLKSSVVLRTCE
ncbi:MAG: hypothetical protein QXJ92_00490 [Candidatus Pacearchaeota archaeon]